MIEIKFHKTGSLIRLTMNGHADYSEFGTDTICASASILTYTLAQMVSNADKGGALKKKPTIKLTSGYSKIECHPIDKDAEGELMRMFLFAEVGFQLLSQNYSEYVSIAESI